MERPFPLEEKYNFNNRSCTPSFHQYVNRWVDEALRLQQSHSLLKRLKELKSIFADYPLQDTGGRQKICKRSERLLNEAKTLAFLERDIQYIKGVGPKRASDLKKLGISDARTLLMHFPRRYEDRSKFTPISEVNPGDQVTVKGRIRARDEQTTFNRMKITKAIVDDGSDKIIGVWFNQPYIKTLLPIGKEVILSGKVLEFKEKQIAHPVFEMIEDNDPVHTGRIVPLYPLVKEINMRYLRSLVNRILEDSEQFLAEYLPEDLIEKRGLMSFGEAIRKIHFPLSMEEKEKARKRFIYEEFLLLQIGLLLIKKKKKGKGIKFSSGGDLTGKLENVLKFSLTDSQKGILTTIEEDMTSPHRMIRLVHGEVGSGKTAIALGACLLARENGYQSAIMVPTGILAEQHYLTLQKYAPQLGMEVGLLLSDQTNKERVDTLQKLKNGSIDVIIGTHALLQKDVVFQKLGLAVIDE
ncbi:MAG TPA: DEAD/DEAH box helicase, partial [Candidatus Omnitrophica bacterium]|nr:DEAD/DEAH box helicase [Candidatus Omnitrophota bacterium]